MKHVEHLLILTAVFNSPAIFVWIPFVKLLFLLPFLFWINIPTQWLGLGEFLGPTNFDLSSFGYWPKTPRAWLSIVAFWKLLAAGLTLLTAGLPPLKRRFGLRALFIVTTLLAIVLGLVGYALR